MQHILNIISSAEKSLCYTEKCTNMYWGVRLKLMSEITILVRESSGGGS